MAFANKYRFRFESVHGVEYNIYILKDGYSGQVIQRALGRAPVIKKKKNGPICGTSLELYVECAVDGEFAELYTSNPKEYRVDVYRGGNGGTLIWTGFVSTELYSEPSIAPPYDVQIVATDGLGELKLNNFEPQGEVTMKALFKYLLSFTGSDRAFYFATNLKHTGGTKSQMLSWTINVDFLKDKTCYEVLTQLLDSIHATITTYGGRWLVVRETDIETLLTSSGGLSVITLSASGSVSTTTISNVRRSLGQMGVADFWPNGNLSTAIEPARKSVAVQAPWHMVGAFKGGDLTDQASVSYWSKDNFQTLDSRDLTWKPSTHFVNSGGEKAYYIGDCLTGSNYGHIAQDILMLNINSLDFEIEINVKPRIEYDINQWVLQHGKVNAYLKYTDATGTLYGTADAGWMAVEPKDYVDVGRVDVIPFQTLRFSIPQCMLRSTTSGTLTLYIKGRNIAVNYANMKISREKGYIDTVHIDNGARGEENIVEILGSRVLQDNVQNPDFYQGIWKYSGSVLYSFADSNHSSGDFMSIQALDRAVSVALARTRTEGVVDMPSTYAMFPLMFLQGQQNSWVETWEWDLKNEDVKISCLSTPNAQITVDSESVEPMEGDGSSSSGGGSGSGGGSSVQANVGLTMPTGFDVDGSPVVGRGTIAVVFSNGYSLPLTADTQKGVSAYSWGDHSQEGYLKTAADIAAALGYVPASSTNAADLRRPRLKILRGWQNRRDPSLMAPTLLADHPLRGIGDAEFVLMVWSKRRGKGIIPGQAQYAWDGSQYKSAWGECRGALATTAPLTFNGGITLDDLRLHILHTLVCIYGQSKPTSMTLAQFHALDTRYNPPRFGGLNNFSGTLAEFKEKTTGMRLFGIALRYTNPAFTSLVSGELDETTRQLKSGASTYVDRYIYSDIAPIVVQIGASATPGQSCEIGFDIAGRLP